MAAAILRRLYAPEYLVKPEARLGELPNTRETYRETLRVAIPSMSESLLMATVSIADTMMVGTVGAHAIAAVGLITQPRFIILTLVVCLNVAITSIIARRKGENDLKSAGQCLRQGIILSLIFSLIPSLLASVFAEQILWFAGAQPDTILPAMDYFRVILMGTPVCCLSLTICASQRGYGRTRISMQVNIVANLVNLLFNYLLIGGKFGFPRLETKGAAIATVIGWSVGLVMAIISVSRRDDALTIITKKDWLFDSRTVGAIYKVAAGVFVEQIFMRTGMFTYSKIVASLGTTMLAANLIGMNLITISFSIGDGLSIAASALVGYNLGAKRPDLSVLYGKVCQRIAICCIFWVFLLFTFGGGWLYSLFTDEPAIIEIGKTITLLASFIVFGQAAQFIYTGILRGAGDTKYTAIVSMCSVLLVRPALAYFLCYTVGWALVGAWLALLSDQYLRLLLTYLRFRSGKWTKIAI